MEGPGPDSPDLGSLKRLRAVRLRGARGPFDLFQFANSLQSLVCSSCRGFGKLPKDLERVFPAFASLDTTPVPARGRITVILGTARGSRSSNDSICRATR